MTQKSPFWGVIRVSSSDFYGFSGFFVMVNSP